MFTMLPDKVFHLVVIRGTKELPEAYTLPIIGLNLISVLLEHFGMTESRRTF